MVYGHPLPRHTLVAPTGLQFATGAFGAALGLVFTCPAVAAAGVGALGDGWRYAGDSPAATLRGAFGAAAAFAAASIAYPFFIPHFVSGWTMLGFALVGLVVNAAAVLAAIPERLSALHPVRVRASDATYAMLAGSGAIALAWPEGWVCAVAAAGAALALGAEWLVGRRLQR